MSQITTGVRSILSSPVVYDTLQRLLGADASRRRVCQQHIRAQPGDVIVDIGCGTAEILDWLPQGIQYYGFDLSPSYIRNAQARYGSRPGCHFRCADITSLGPEEIPPCDIAIATGVLHHIDDEDAKALLRQIHGRLSPRGRLMTVDPALLGIQSPFARAIIRCDRGQNVRSPEGYLALVPDLYRTQEVFVHHDLIRVPYTHAILMCGR